MRLKVYKDVNIFIGDTFDILLKNEITNNMIISNCIRGMGGADTSDWYMATVNDSSNNIILIIMMTPPFNLVICEVINNENSYKILADELINNKIIVPGVFAQQAWAQRFKDLYCEATCATVNSIFSMRVYKLEKVNDTGKTNGQIRLARKDDLYFLPYWQSAFSIDCGIHPQDISEGYERIEVNLKNNTLFIWEDAMPVSQAAIGRKTENGVVINAVYTPPFFRGRGYAMSTVAKVSQHALDNGAKFCSLFADLSNPISNSIYKKIGYIGLCDFEEYRFTKSEVEKK